MAKIEGGELGDAGRVREWLARAVNAPRDPAWTADGIVSDTWAPVSPVTGHLDAFQWRVPVESATGADQTAILDKLEELVALGASTAKTPAEPQVSLPPREPKPPVPSPVRHADDADVIDLPKPRSAAVAPTPQPATVSAAKPVAPASRPFEPKAPNPAEGVLRTVRATTATTAASTARKATANTVVTPHAPDDPGTDGDDLIEPKRPYVTPYTVPVKQRT